jgi:hypothetical protein
MVQLFLSRSNSHASCTDFLCLRSNLCDSATYHPIPPRNIHSGFEAKPMKLSPGGFETQPTKPPRVAYSICVIHHSTRVTAILDQLVAKSSRAPSTRSTTVLSRSTWSLHHVHLRLSMFLDVSHRSWSPSLLVPQSKPHVCPSPLPVHRHRPPPPNSTPTHHKTRDIAQPNSRHG